MITFKINTKKVLIPTAWPDISYQQYISLLRIPQTLPHYISLFSGIDIKILQNAEIKNLEKISIALSFLSLSPHFERTAIVGKYVLPEDVTIQSVGQFEDLRQLLSKHPQKEKDQILTIEENELLADLYLSACAIYVQKIKDGKYDYTKVAAVKEELKSASCAEVIGTGAFFLFRPLNISPPTMNPFQKFLTRLKRWSQDLPGYQKTLDFFQRSSR